MRTRFLALAFSGLLTLSFSAAFAQDTPPPPPDQSGPPAGGPGGRGMRMDPDRQLTHLTHALNLTADQQNQIKPLLAERQQKLQALFQDQSLAPQDRRQQARTISENTNNSIKAILNDEQKQKFDAMEKHMHRNGRGGESEGPPPPPPTEPQP